MIPVAGAASAMPNKHHQREFAGTEFFLVIRFLLNIFRCSTTARRTLRALFPPHHKTFSSFLRATTTTAPPDPTSNRPNQTLLRYTIITHKSWIWVRKYRKCRPTSVKRSWRKPNKKRIKRLCKK
jgi:hypothetical protein